MISMAPWQIGVPIKEIGVLIKEIGVPIKEIGVLIKEIGVLIKEKLLNGAIKFPIRRFNTRLCNK